MKTGTAEKSMVRIVHEREGVIRQGVFDGVGTRIRPVTSERDRNLSSTVP